MASTSVQMGKSVSVRNEGIDTPSSPGSRSQTEHEFDFRESDNVATQEDIPPDGGYGWVVTACVFIINAHTWGINSVSILCSFSMTHVRSMHMHTPEYSG